MVVETIIRILLFKLNKYKWRHYLFLCEAVLVVQDVDAFVNCHQPNCGSWVASDLQTKHPARFIRCNCSWWFQLKLGQWVRHWVFYYKVQQCPRNTEITLSLVFSVNPFNQCCASHRAHTGVLDIHPNWVWHHFIVICMVVDYNAEWWQHFLGNFNHPGNQYLALCLVMTIFHQLTSAQDLTTQIYTSALIRLREYILPRLLKVTQIYEHFHKHTHTGTKKSLTKYVMSFCACLLRIKEIFRFSPNETSAVSIPGIKLQS